MSAEELAPLCPACGLPYIPGEECGHCLHKTPTEDEPRQAAPMPKGFYLRRGEYRRNLYWALNYYFLIGAGITGLLAHMCLSQALNDYQTDGSISFWFLLFGLPLAYLTAAFLTNRTQIRISSQRFRVRRGPFRIPLDDNIDLKAEEIYSWSLVREPTDEGKDTFGVKVTTVDDRSFDIASLLGEEPANNLRDFLETVISCRGKRRLTRVLEEDRRRRQENPGLETDPHAWKISKLYYMGIYGMFGMDMVSFILFNYLPLEVDKLFFWLLGIFPLGIFGLFYFHHRKYLSIWDSNPRRAGEPKYGPIAYILSALVFAALWSPNVLLLRALIALVWK